MKARHHFRRLIFLATFFSLIFTLLAWRMADLTIFDRAFLLHQGAARSIRTVEIPAYRGNISDRFGTPLAVSTPVQSIWINPKTFSITAEALARLAPLLAMKPQQLKEKIGQHIQREFLYLYRQAPPGLSKKIKDLSLPGLNFQEEFKRYYPQGDSVAPLIGFTNIDDQGIEGLEWAYQEWLMGIQGKKKVLKDRLGQVIAELGLIKAPRAGNELRLSIDRRIQYLAYRALQETLEKFSAKAGTVLVLDTQKGEVLAVANAPSFNPNAREHYTPEHYRNRAFTDAFEPGSVIKPFSIASALESGRFHPQTIIDTRPSWMMVQGHMIRDVHNYGILDVRGVMQHSSNVGVSKMVLASPPEQLLQVLNRCGFGQRSETNYPGENVGALISLREAGPFNLATLGFGYGISVTPLQLAKAYLIFANHGKLLPVSLLHQENKPEGEQIIKAKIADQVLSMMEAVLDKEGTGKLARIEGYRVAGKTGTARIAGKKGYASDRHIASFVGIAPVSSPKLIVVVVIHEPKKNSYYGSMVAAPLFAEVMSGALHILEVPPDRPLE